MSLTEAFTAAILPVLSVAVVGFVLGRVRDVDVDPLATVALYVLTPALVFHSLATTPIAGRTVLRLTAGVLGYTLAMAAVAAGVGRLVGEPRSTRGAMVLTSSFPNAGNYGIPLSAFAFGALGRSTAVLYIAAQAVLMYTLGVYVASRGATGSAREAAVQVFRLPLVYAVAAAGVASWLGAVPPTDGAAMQTVELTGDAAIPVMLLVLGIQLADTLERVGFGAVSRVAPTSLLKLAVAPVVAVGVAVALGLTGTVGRVFVLECAMPAAVTPLVLVVEFGGETDGLSAADYVSTAVLVTTAASVVTLTVLIAALQAGVVL